MTKLFQNRNQAGKELVIKLKDYLQDEIKDLQNAKDSIIIVAIPRGGVEIGDILASYFHCTLDVVISRKIGAPSNQEFAIGAVMPGGSYFVNQHIVNVLKISDNYI